MNFNETADSNDLYYYPDYYGEMTDTPYNDAYYDYTETDAENYNMYNYDHGQYSEATLSLEAPPPSTNQNQNELGFHKGRTNPEPE